MNSYNVSVKCMFVHREVEDDHILITDEFTYLIHAKTPSDAEPEATELAREAFKQLYEDYPETTQITNNYEVVLYDQNDTIIDTFYAQH